MNHYPHHIGDFNTATRHLSRLERGLYRDMLDMYYDTESALDGSDMARLARRLLCRTDEEVSALQFLLEEFFELQEDGQYVQARCEREFDIYRQQQVGRDVVKKNENSRQVRSRARRSAIFSALRSKGVAPSFNAKMPDLLALCREHGVIVTEDGAHVPGDSHVTARDTACHVDVTANQNQNQNHINTPQPPAGGDVWFQAAQDVLAHFPEHRRTRAVEAAGLIRDLVGKEAVSREELVAAAKRQSKALGKDGGKACPGLPRWLRESRWLDVSVQVAEASVPENWRDTRSGVIAMGMSLGLGSWDEAQEPYFARYEARVERALSQKDAVAA